MRSDLTIELPNWLGQRLTHVTPALLSCEDRMRFVIDLARENVEQGTGGPFAAGVFDADGRLLAAGVNMVVQRNCSLLHAEVVAIALAQQGLGRYDLSDGGRHAVELATSTEPCAMCFGAVFWSGVTRLVCGARDEDARSIGFDEGPKLPDWREALEQRGIAVQRDLLRDEAVDVLRHYAETGGEIYNPTRGEAEPI